MRLPTLARALRSPTSAWMPRRPSPPHASGTPPESTVCRAIDVTNPDHVNQVVAEIEAELGKIDILVNSAGINIRKDVIDYTPEEWFRIINTNLSGVFFVTQAVARGMLARGYGRVISIGSVSSLMGHPQHAPYAATKGGVAIMTKAMATEWATKGVTVNAIGPAYTVTGLITELMNRPGKVPRNHRDDPDGPPRQAGGHRRRGGLPRLRRGQLRHRPDHLRRRRPHRGLSAVVGRACAAGILIWRRYLCASRSPAGRRPIPGLAPNIPLAVRPR